MKAGVDVRDIATGIILVSGVCPEVLVGDIVQAPGLLNTTGGVTVKAGLLCSSSGVPSSDVKESFALGREWLELGSSNFSIAESLSEILSVISCPFSDLLIC